MPKRESCGKAKRRNATMAISSIEQKGSYYELYDERGKKYETIHHSKGDLLGWSDSFFILRKGSYYDLYDEFGKKYESIHHSKGEFVSITGDTFILRHGSYNDTYDKWGDKLSSRHV